MGRIAAIVLVVLSTVLTAQQQAPAFDVASIKPNVSAANAAIQLTPNGRFTATNTSLRALIQVTFINPPTSRNYFSESS